MALYRFCIFLFFLCVLITLSCTSDDSIETHGYNYYTDYYQKDDAEEESYSEKHDRKESSDLSEKKSFSLQHIAKAGSKLAPKLYSKVIAEKEGSNIIMSALSVECVLAVASLGAKGNTAKEIKKSFSLPSNDKLLSNGFREVMEVLNADQKESVSVEVSNHVYVSKHARLLDDFEQNANTIQKGIAENVDFSNAAKATKHINDQVKKDTKGKISKLFSEDSIDADTKLVLVNALYFKGKWKAEFNKKMTETNDFYVSSSKKVKTDLMRTQGQFSVVDIPNANARALQLPYKGNRFSMVIILPNERDGIKKLEQDISKMDFSKDIPFEKPHQTFHITLPKFKIETSMVLISALKELGVKDIFDRDRADLSGFTGRKGLYASMLLQKAFIEVNEEGTEAAAATVMVVSSRSLSVPPSFICDHPFVFFIKDFKTGLISFTGRVMDPSNK